MVTSEPGAISSVSCSWSECVKHELLQFSIGMTSGVIGFATIYPIDSVKTRIQNSQTRLSYGDTIRGGFYGHGIRGFYKGIFPALLGMGPAQAVRLTMNDYSRTHMVDKNGNVSITCQMAAGAMGGAMGGMFLNPTEVIKIRLQLEPTTTVSKLVRDTGIRGLCKGLTPCMMRNGTFSSIYFPAYESIKKNLNGVNSSTRQNTLLAGFLAAIPASILATPADVIKTRVQAKAKTGVEPYTGMTKTAVRIIAEEGIPGLFRGTRARCLVVIPQQAITIFIYEFLKSYYEPHKQPAAPHPESLGGLKHTTNSALRVIEQYFDHGLPSFEIAHTGRKAE